MHLKLKSTKISALCGDFNFTFQEPLPLLYTKKCRIIVICEHVSKALKATLIVT